MYGSQQKGNIGSKGLAKDKHEVEGKLFGYEAYNIQRKNVSLV